MWPHLLFHCNYSQHFWLIYGIAEYGSARLLLTCHPMRGLDVATSIIRLDVSLVRFLVVHKAERFTTTQAETILVFAND